MSPLARCLPNIGGPQEWTSPQGLASTLQVMLLLTVISLAPAILLMTTSFVRIIVVFGLLRQALGTQQLPPSQVITSIALFMTVLLMAPVWKQSYDEGIKPYTESQISLEEAFDRGVGADAPVHGRADHRDRERRRRLSCSCSTSSRNRKTARSRTTSTTMRSQARRRCRCWRCCRRSCSAS